MISLPVYSRYERPGDPSPEDPLVLVRKNVISDVGMPEVNYDGLYDLFHRDLGIPTRIQPKVKLYGGSLLKRAWRDYFCGATVPADFIYGYHAWYTRTIHINAATTVRKTSVYGCPNQTMQVLIHEARHLADSHTRSIRVAGELAVRAAILTGSSIVANKIDPLVGALTYMPIRAAYYALDPAEHRAREAETSQLFDDHLSDIVFPPFSRYE